MVAMGQTANKHPQFTFDLRSLSQTLISDDGGTIFVNAFLVRKWEIFSEWSILADRETKRQIVGENVSQVRLWEILD
jgi:hypothetical protein